MACPTGLPPQVKDAKTGDCYRADHLLEAALEGALEDTKNPLSKEAAFVSCPVLCDYELSGAAWLVVELAWRTLSKEAAHRSRGACCRLVGAD